MAHVRFWNPSPLDHNTGEPVPGPLLSEFHLGDHMPLADMVLALTHADGGGWVKHAQEAPTWVWSDVEALEEALARFFGCARGNPDDAAAAKVAPGRHEAAPVAEPAPPVTVEVAPPAPAVEAPAPPVAPVYAPPVYTPPGFQPATPAPVAEGPA